MSTLGHFAERRRAFVRLHESGCFVIPNPWDPGSARYLEQLGFKALATTSGGFAFSQGLPDIADAITRDRMLQHVAEIVNAVELPVNADFQSGYARDPDEVAESFRLCMTTGVAGISIEDATDDPAVPLFDLSLAVERVRAARAAVDAAGGNVVLTARAECYLVGHPDPFKESVRRLRAYAKAGADVLYAPGISDCTEIEQIVEELAPKPVNILMSRSNGLTLADLAQMGVRRVSVGSSLARAAWTGFMRAAQLIAEEGSFSAFDAAVPYAELNKLFMER
jgi:2-methylisocitrate lyase-like PEP mutase family enzyme